MGFGATIGNITAAGIDDAVLWIGDFAGPLTAVVGLGMFALAVSIIVRAVKG